MQGTINHPLAVGTRVYYEDLDGGTGTITHNTTTPALFAAAVAACNAHTRYPVPAGEVDYVIDFDDLGPLPVQREGVLRVL